MEGEFIPGNQQLGNISSRFNREDIIDADFTVIDPEQLALHYDRPYNQTKFGKINRPIKVGNNYGPESSRKFQARMNRRRINKEARNYKEKANSNFVRDKAGVKSSIFPGRKMGGRYTGDWGLGKEQVRAATAEQMLNRAKVFAFGGSGYKREALRNSFGLLSKQQKMLEGMPGFMVAGQNALIGANLISDAWNGNFDDLGIDAASYFGGAVGFRTGQALGTAYGKRELLTLNGVSKNVGWRIGAARGGNIEGFFRGPARSTAASILRSGRLAGAIGGGIGALAGAAIVGGIAAAGFGMVTSNNMLNKLAYDTSKLDMNHNFFETEQSLTNRQRGLQAISKSAMNDRGQLLGNEASVLAFGY